MLGETVVLLSFLYDKTVEIQIKIKVVRLAMKLVAMMWLRCSKIEKEHRRWWWCGFIVGKYGSYNGGAVCIMQHKQ